MPQGVLEFEAILCVYPCCHFCVASVSTCFLSHMVNVERGVLNAILATKVKFCFLSKTTEGCHP